MKTYSKRIIGFFCCVTLIVMMAGGCKSSGKLAYKNIAAIYNPELVLEDLNYDLFNLNDSITNLYVRFPYDKLQYSEINGRKEARYKLTWQLFQDFENSKLIDSAAYRGMDSLHTVGYKFDSIAIAVKNGSDYVIFLSFFDLNAGKQYDQWLNLYKKGPVNPTDYILTDEKGFPLMRNYVYNKEHFRIRTALNEESVMLGFNPQSMPPAPPPYALPKNVVFPYADSITAWRVSNHYSEIIQLSDEGRYNVVENGKRAFTIFRFYDGFPNIGQLTQLRQTARYIATDAEYRDLMESDSRAAIDDFWIRLTGHSERALSQIRRYYGRIEKANQWFTLSREGWKSDRGMIFTIFGPPTVVYHNATSEEWTYGEPGNPMSVRFLFILEVVPGLPADYRLIRSDSYRTPWHLNISNWRR